MRARIRGAESAELEARVEKEITPDHDAHVLSTAESEMQREVRRDLSEVGSKAAVLIRGSVMAVSGGGMPASGDAIRSLEAAMLTDHKRAAIIAVTAASGRSGTRSVSRTIGTIDAIRRAPAVRLAAAERMVVVLREQRDQRELGPVVRIHDVLAILEQVRDRTRGANLSKVLEAAKAEDSREADLVAFRSVVLAAKKAAALVSARRGALLVAAEKVASGRSVAAIVGAMVLPRELAIALPAEIVVGVDSIRVGNG